MDRISRQQMFMDIAWVAARRSTCYRLNVGAVIVHANNPIALGYNGSPSGEPHCAGNDCPGVVPGNCPTLHAEVNALSRLKPHGWKGHEELDLYVTNSPCMGCVERMVSLGKDLPLITRVFFQVPYRDSRPLEKLFNTGIEVYQVTPAGYIIDPVSGRMVDHETL